MALTPATLDPVKPQVLHPRLAELWFIRCQTSLNSLIYGANFGNYVRVTDSGALTHHKRASNQGCKFIRSSRSWKRGSSRRGSSRGSTLM